MKDEPTRLIDEDPEFARLFAASEEDLPSPARVDDAVLLAKRVVASSRWSVARWLGPGAAIVGVAMIGFFAMSNTSSNVGTGTKSEGPPTATASPGPTTTTLVTASAVATMPPVATTIALPTVPTETGAAEPAPKEPALAAVSANVVRGTAPRERPTTVAARPQAGATPAPAEGSTFDEQLALLTAARSGLETRDIASCLRAVERYEGRFPSGLFAQEIEVIRIDALATSGQRANAHALAERFLTQNPGSPYAARVRSIAERTKD